MDDITTLTDDHLDQLRRDVLTEQERRARVAQAPDELAHMARAALDAGADPGTLRAAVDTALTAQE